MRISWESAPLPVIGYLSTLIGFVFLGSFTAALAFGSSLTPWLGAAMIVSYALAAGCFVLRHRHIAAAHPDSHTVLGIDPIRGNVDRRAAERYLARYRGRPGAQPELTPTGAQRSSETPLAEAA
ncbi:hypothetical protein ACNUDN_01370 [Mycobacterium sp. smrl_JER01]|uniref:hypothetical protein n=1 Tax=Mycobacterium sp. smrl_JER01 TaxID=3402633 RepID=UPI003ACC9319